VHKLPSISREKCSRGRKMQVTYNILKIMQVYQGWVQIVKLRQGAKVETKSLIYPYCWDMKFNLHVAYYRKTKNIIAFVKGSESNP
jgi:hypothetical protein